MFHYFPDVHVADTVKLAGFVTFCLAVFLGGFVAIPILAEHFFGNRRQPAFVVDLLLFGGVCAVLAAVLMAEKLSTHWTRESQSAASPARPPQSRPDAWAERVRYDACAARASS